MKLTDKLGLNSHAKLCLKLYKKHGIGNVIDLGAGKNPQLEICQKLRIRQLLIDVAYPEERSEYLTRLRININDMSEIDLAVNNFCKINDNQNTAIISIQNLEHLTTTEGLNLIKFLESSMAKLIVIETPNGFVHQLPAVDNPFQQHVSGWTVSDFKRLGFKVRGTSGLKFLHNNYDKGSYKWNMRGIKLLDVLLSRLLFVTYFPRMAFNILAFKVKA